jgi:hypothetical protein
MCHAPGSAFEVSNSGWEVEEERGRNDERGKKLGGKW